MELLRGLINRLTGVEQQAPEDLNHVEYQVKPDTERDLSLVFSTRREAREYKHLLASSRYGISSVIVRREWDSGFIADERKVS